MCLGIPGQILSIDRSNTLLLLAQIDFGGIAKEISLCFTPDAEVGNYVVVHVGFAISIINEQQAQDLIIAIDQPSEDNDEISI
jgi:hydrogenase expression/formation protein HypC